MSTLKQSLHVAIMITIYGKVGSFAYKQMFCTEHVNSVSQKVMCPLKQMIPFGSFSNHAGQC